MKHVLQNSKVFAFAGLLFIVIGTSAWQLKGSRQNIHQKNVQAGYDTTKPGTNYSDKIDLRINIDSIVQAAQIAISAIDYNKLQQDINASIAKINFEEINKNIEASLKSVDWNKMKADMAKSLDEAKASIAKINTEELQEALAKVKVELNSQQFKQSIDLKHMQQQIQQSMAIAKEQIAKAKTELHNYKSFIAALREDGLIKPDQPFKIELKNGELYINGVKQAKEITEKYRRFYPGKTDFSIFDKDDDTDNNEPESTDL